MREHNTELKSELKLTQRTTHRTEENIVNLEKNKKEQDILIDQMNEEIKRLKRPNKHLGRADNRAGGSGRRRPRSYFGMRPLRWTR